MVRLGCEQENRRNDIFPDWEDENSRFRYFFVKSIPKRFIGNFNLNFNYFLSKIENNLKLDWYLSINRGHYHSYKSKCSFVLFYTRVSSIPRGFEVVARQPVRPLCPVPGIPHTTSALSQWQDPMTWRRTPGPARHRTHRSGKCPQPQAIWIDQAWDFPYFVCRMTARHCRQSTGILLFAMQGHLALSHLLPYWNLFIWN
jgi:hypothetical protein